MKSLKNLAGHIITAVSVLGVVLAILYAEKTWDHGCLDSREADIYVDSGKTFSFMINSDTTRRVYLINDTLTNIIWIGVAGKVVTK